MDDADRARQADAIRAEAERLRNLFSGTRDTRDDGIQRDAAAVQTMGPDTNAVSTQADGFLSPDLLAQHDLQMRRNLESMGREDRSPLNNYAFC